MHDVLKLRRKFGFEILPPPFFLSVCMHFEGLSKMATKENTVNERDFMAAVIHCYVLYAEAPSCLMAPDFVLALGCGQLELTCKCHLLLCLPSYF